MKKLLCIFLVLSMILSVSIMVAAAETHEITSAVFPYYDGEDKSGAELTLCFLDGANDMPWIEANDLLVLLTSVYHNTVDFSMTAESPVVTYTRINKLYDTDVPLSIDFDKNVMTFADYNLFTMRAEQSTMLDLTSITVAEEFADMLPCFFGSRFFFVSGEYSDVDEVCYSYDENFEM